MIDIENYLFTQVKNSLPKSVNCGAEYTKQQSNFPFLTLSVIDNSVLERFIDSACLENAAEITVEVNVFSNKSAGKKEECKKIMRETDTVLSDLNLTRTMCQPMPNLQDATIYRMTARYRAVVDKNFNIYRR